MKALETSKSCTLASIQKTQVETQLRATITDLQHRLSLSKGQCSQYKNELKLLQEQQSILQTKLMRCQQEKRSMERDSRAALSLARSMDQYGNSDTIFYKKKVKL